MDFYAYQRPVGKIDDIPKLRDEFIAIFDEKSKEDAVIFGLLYGRRLLDITGVPPCKEITDSFIAMRRWLEGKTSYHEARNIPFSSLCRSVRKENDALKLRLYQTMAQISCIPHVKFHALWASDFAVALVNRLYPNNMAEVRKERKAQSELLRYATSDPMISATFRQT
ncbi:MAG: hypothetical protein LBH11_06195 [Propionibacteriaceae bacterium]|jgi:hypothetical protein|nr:hypothetical protein [Propionibacteriaceae bacterium]